MTSLATADGVVLAARTWSPRGDRARPAAVVLAHGFSASKDDPNVVALAERLSSVGLTVVSYDARGHGASGGSCTLGDLERHDVAAAVAYVREQDDSVPVVLLGASMGAVAVLGYAADNPGSAGVVTVSSPAQWRLPRTARALFAAALTRTGIGRRVAARRLRVRVDRRWSSPQTPSQMIGRIGAPTSIVHGAADRFIPSEAAVLLHAAATEPRQLVIVPGMGHAFDPAGLPQIVDAVGWVLSPLPIPTTTPGRPAPGPYGPPSLG